MPRSATLHSPDVVSNLIRAVLESMSDEEFLSVTGARFRRLVHDRLNGSLTSFAQLEKQAAPREVVKRPTTTKRAHARLNPEARTEAVLGAIRSGLHSVGEIVGSTGLNTIPVRVTLSKLVEEGKLSRTGNTRATRYELKERATKIIKRPAKEPAPQAL